MSASGQYEISHQQANLTREQVKSAHLDNRRKEFDQLAYERANTPTMSQIQAANRQEQLAQARNNPPLSQIWAGTVLNLLLSDIQNYRAQAGIQGAEVPLDPEILKHISLTTGTSTASSTMFNNGGKLRWPPELDDERFDAQRKSIDKLFLDATQQAVSPDGVSGRTLRELSASINKLQADINAAIDDMTPTDNIRAMKYARQLASSVQMLKDPTVANQLNGKWAPRGNTVGELIDNMTRDGLRFGPATPADQPFYTALYQAILEYDSSILALVARSQQSTVQTAPMK
jgi:hypothetical protein